MDKFCIVATLLFTIGAGFCLASLPADAQELKAKGEAEGKLMMYATFTAADSKTLLDGFKQVYPKIDAAYYRSNDAALMERFVSENRAGQNLCDVIVTTSSYGNAIKKRGLFAPYELIRGMNRIPDRIDTPPDQARLIENIKPAFAPAEVLDNFERYAKLFHEIFGGR